MKIHYFFILLVSTQYTICLRFGAPFDCSEVKSEEDVVPITLELKLESIGDIDEITIEEESSSEIYLYEVPPIPTSDTKTYHLCLSETPKPSCLVPLMKDDSTVALELNLPNEKLYYFSAHLVDSRNNSHQANLHLHLSRSVQAINSDKKLTDNLRLKQEQRATKEKERQQREEELSSNFSSKRVYPELLSIRDDFLDDEFLTAIKSSSPSGINSILRKVTNTGIYSFPLFKKEFCDKLVEEVDNIQKYEAVQPPNSMNNYGVILDEYGYRNMLNELINKYISKIAAILYPEWGGATIDDHHGFVVQYEIGKDTALDYHMDSCEITLNVLLGKNFTGGSLYFNGVRGDPSEKVEDHEYVWAGVPTGHAILHLGQHWHGANPITSGERYNLILWMMSSFFRSSSTEKVLNHCATTFLPQSLKDEL